MCVCAKNGISALRIYIPIDKQTHKQARLFFPILSFPFQSNPQ